VQFTAGSTESSVGKTGGSSLRVSGVLGSDFSTDFSEGGFSVVFAEVDTDVIGEVEFSLESFSDHVFFDLFLFSGLVFLVNVVLSFKFISFFLFDFDHLFGGFFEERFLFVEFNLLDFKLFLILFFVFSFSEHSFEAFSFFFESFGLFFNSSGFVFHVSLSGGFFGSFKLEFFRNLLKFRVNVVLFFLINVFQIFSVRKSSKSSFMNMGNFFFFIFFNLFNMFFNISINSIKVKRNINVFNFTVLEMN